MKWLLHGAVGMAADWDPLWPEEAARAVDLWSYLATGGLSMEAFAERLNAEAAADEEAPVLVGYSMGGRLALHCLLADPERWKAAVIVSAHPGIGGVQGRLERMADDAQWAGKALTSDWGKFLSDWEGQGMFMVRAREPHWGDRTTLEPRREAVARSFMEWSLGKQEDLRERLGEIACPVLWVTGQLDARFTDLAREAVPLLPRARHEVVSGTGHRVPWDAPEHFRELVESFLEEVGG